MTTDGAAPQGGGHIGIFLFDGVEELDFAGPWEVLAWWTRGFPEDGYTCSTFSADGRPVTCNKGLSVTPHHARADLPPMACSSTRAATPEPSASTRTTSSGCARPRRPCHC
ncbi:MAG TPA: hypothetical protein VKB55_09195 [Nocardioidaceae bacterium]|nr:hypothetical protein [Nocardioidaceae bacterium]